MPKPIVIEDNYNILYIIMTSIIDASRNNDINRVRQLLQEGADPNIQDNYGLTALFIASKRNINIVELLLNNHADPNIQSIDGFTALMIASSDNRYINIVELLLHRGANINIQDNAGKTALIVASHFGHIEIVELLLDSGANPDIRNRNGHTALGFAEHNGFTDIVNLFERGDVFDTPPSPNIKQMRNEAARNIQSKIRGKQTRRRLTQKRPNYGRMATPTTNREKMRRWTDLTNIYDEDDPMRGYEQFSFFPERLVPDVSRGTWREYDENERMADYLETMDQYGGGYRRNRYY